MSKVSKRYWLAAVAALLLMVPGLAAAEKAPPKPYVVLVGVGDFKDPAIKPRPKAEADVKALYDLLTDPKHFDAPAGQVKLLLGSKDEKRNAELATHENVLKAIRWAAEKAGPDDLVLFAFVGQGGPLADRTCYFVADSTLKDRAKNALGASEIEDEFEKLKSTRVCVLLDVNFKGYDPGTEKISETGLTKRFQEYAGGKENSDAPPKPITYVSSTNGILPSIDLKDNGLFMAVVLDALKGSADNEGGEADGLISIDELSDYIRRELPKRAQQEVKQDQRPLGFGQSTHFALTKNPKITASIDKRIARLEQLAKDGKIDDAVLKEGRELLGRMPRLDSQRQLRKKYQRLADDEIALGEFMKQRQEVIASLKLPRDEAEAFGEKVLRVARTAKRFYVKQLTLNELAAAAVKGLFRRVDEKIPKELSDRLAKVKDLSEDDLKTLLADAREHLGNREDLKGQKAVDMALNMMMHSLDNYSTWIDPDSLEEFKRQTEQRFIGVGIQIQKDFAKDMVRVTTPLRGSPAYKAGIKAGDIISTITNTVDKEGKKLATPEVISTKGMEIGDVVKKILGKMGTEVMLTIEREGAEKPLEIKIVRGLVEVETVLGVKRNEDDSWDYYVDGTNKIAYVRLTQFGRNTERDLKATVGSLMKTGLNGLILDLRFNPGGYLDSAVEICDLFIDDGLIVSIRPREGSPNEKKEYKGKHEGSLLDFPIVCLVNGGSASASEIVSACLQDHNRGVIMGERSFGKGSVQNIMAMNLGGAESAVKLSIASFWRPNGKNLNKFPTSTEKDDWGVLPEKEYTIKLEPKELGELSEHLRKIEIVPNRDKKAEPSTFEDRQLKQGLKYIKEQVTAKSTKKAG